MKLKVQMLRIMPASLRRKQEIRDETKELQQVKSLECNVKSLRSVYEVDLKKLFACREIEDTWTEIKERLDEFVIPEMTGGANPGDRKAMYYLIRKFKPLSVLEVGTHIGASTIHIASALYMNQIKERKSGNLVSVDIGDVNNRTAKPWLKYGATSSPLEMVQKMHFESFVSFTRSSSLDYFRKCEQTFDFIFLDGDHTAKTVYQEILAALRLLNKDGIILLHDYFPDEKPLWPDGLVIPGPSLALTRLQREGAKLTVLPLGELPWPTKLQSNISSLALLLRNEPRNTIS